MTSRLYIRWRTMYGSVLLLVCLLLTVSGMGIAQGSFVKHRARHLDDGNVPVFTFKYNNQRTGANTHEMLLNTKNVNDEQFGQLISYPVNGQIYAQPLYAPAITVHGQIKNLVIAATEGNSVYAFDADQTDPEAGPVWEADFAGALGRTVTSADVHCNDLNPSIGITSTPVIDGATNTLFVTSFLTNQGRFTYYLHALDLSSGQEKEGSPIAVSAPGGSFNAQMERQRSALLLANGQIYMAFASFCDNPPYHGWLLGYSYDQHIFQRTAALNATPTGSEGGIWGSGSATAADEQGFIYTITGNGTFTLNKGGRDAGDSFLKLTPNLRIVDYFAPFNQSCLDHADNDLGSGGPLLLPGNEITSGTKDGKIYVVHTDSMGHFRAIANPCKYQSVVKFDHIIQELPQRTMTGGIFNVPAYWEGPDGAYVFFSGVKDSTKAFRFTNGKLSGPIAATPDKINFSGGNPVVSSNGTTPDSGILWLTDRAGYLRAYDAANLQHRLYSHQINGYVKFTAPTVSHGKVFVPTAHALEIYGLLPEESQAPVENTPPANSGQPVPPADPGENGDTPPPGIIDNQEHLSHLLHH